MATTETTTKAAAAKDTATTDTKDTFNDYRPVHPTVTDPAGVERIVGAPSVAWVPAPIDPHPDAIKRGEERLAAEEKASKARADAFAGGKDTPKPDVNAVPTVISDASGTSTPPPVAADPVPHT